MGIEQDPPLPTREPIAIVGMAMRLPGRVHDGEAFWNMLIEKRSGLCDVPKDRYNVDAFHHPDGQAGTVRMRQGYFLDDVDIQHFDSSVFSSPKKELERLDPQQRQLLEVSYECLENAGCTSWRGQRIGCYVGDFGQDWQDLNAKETQHMGAYRVTGYDDFVLGNRISYEFDLRGPSMTVKTGCSSSLVCLDLACKALRDGDCDGALIGGTSLIFSPTMSLALSDQGVLSPTGTCKSFDALADGYGRGEAVNAIYIKTLRQAVQDGDPIRAIIRGTSVNCDGRTPGMLTPSPRAQEALIRRAYEVAGIADLGETAMVECHGTGTPVGDPLETTAVAQCFGVKGVIITSVKPNVGHSEGAAGLTSLIKGVLALEHRQVPPNIHFTTPNPKIPWDTGKLHVPVQAEPWPADRAERVSVNSFGIGGVNAHVILDSPRQCGIIVDPGALAAPVPVPNQPHLMLFSAHSPASLQSSIVTYQEYLKQGHASLKDVSYTLANRRAHHSHRGYAVLDGPLSWEASTGETAPSSPQIAWVFTGQGAQWPEMGAELLETNAVFRDTIHKLDRFLRSLPTPPPWTIEEELRKPDGVSRIHEAVMGHPLSIALQIGLIDVLRSWGIVPTVVLGHSSGEMAAAYACGAITAEGAMAAATFRGTSHETSSRKGAMAAIGLGAPEVTPLLEPGVVIACENSHQSVTISGDTHHVERVVNRIQSEQPDVFARFLRVEKAFHSHHMWEYGPRYEEHLRPFIQSHHPQIPIYSAVTGDLLTGEDSLGAPYWRQNMESPVLFNASLRSVLRDYPERLVFIEIGPHPALKGPIRQILQDVGRSDAIHVGTLQRTKPCQESLLQCAGTLFQQQVFLNLAAVCPPGRLVKNLPRYAWQRDTSHWAEPRVAHEWRFRPHPPHELLGSRVIEMGSEPSWRNVLALENVPWLAGHRVSDQIVFPAAGYVAMVGEALRQLDGESTYTVKNVTIASAAVLESDKRTEILTCLRPGSLDSSEQSPWYAFTISSFDGGQWFRNCYGEARVSVDKSVSLQADEPSKGLPRIVDADAWYNVLHQVGFDYSGAFRGLQQISAATVEDQAAGAVPWHETYGNGSYALHPGVIDQCFQLFTVSASRGQARKCRHPAVPTFIEEMVVAPTQGDLHVAARVGALERGSYLGDLAAQRSGQVVLAVKGFKTSALTSAGSASEQVPLITQLEWKPHADFVNMAQLMHPREDCPPEWPLLEELVLLCMLSHHDQVQPGPQTPDHLRKFVAWQEAQLDRYRSGSNPFVSKDLGLCEMSSADRVARIEAIVSRVLTSPYAPFALAIHRLSESAATIFTGETHPLMILGQDDTLAEFYTVVDSLDYAEAIATIGHTNPLLKVLEVGAGTGATTQKILDALTSSQGERLYASYTYTDVSTGFLAPAKELFADYDEIIYSVLDISQDPVVQGLELGSYDLIVASNVLHATPSLQTSLRHLRSLLRSGGRLFLEEPCPEATFYDYVMGYLPGWWVGSGDGRADQPYISPARWSEELVAAGFQAPDAMVLDGIAPYHSSAGIVALAAPQKASPSRVTLLCYNANGPFVQEVMYRLRALDFSVDICLLGQPLPPCQDVISLLDLEDPAIHGMSQPTFKALIGYLHAVERKMVWVTRASQVNCDDPRAAMILGLARTARNELGLDLFTVEVDSATPAVVAADLTANLLLRASSTECDSGVVDPDWEYAIANGEILVPRAHWQTVCNAVAHSSQAGGSSQKQLAIQTPGLLHTMGWRNQEAETLKAGEVLVQTKATGLNFRDVLISLGVLDNSTAELGLEGAGIVQAVGPHVHHVSVGDRVMYLSSGCFATHVTLPETSCVKIDDSMSFELGAALPCVYATATMALIDKARLQPGQSILIHSACGGVGLAAIQIAQMIGAQIYCTVGSESKAQYLVEKHHIERERIYHSRDASFVPDIMRVTNQQGVDVVLNSLSGELLHASWKCVAEFGTMIEIGKRDFRRRAKLSMEAFEANRTFVGLDLWQISQQRPRQAAELLQRCVQWIRSGAIRVNEPGNRFPAHQIQDAFRFMQAGHHVGKIVITMPEHCEDLASLPMCPSATLRPDRSYLLVGGLGGLGRAVAGWMVENGARHLIFLSRSANLRPDTQTFLEELQSQGCQVQLVTGSVGELGDVEKAVVSAVVPIAGVINMSMVLKDVSLTEMEFLDWTMAVEPKVQGTWNLHHAIRTNLDFFILFSSYSGIAGQWGQANYAAANTFLDAFVQYRHRQGLAASVIDIGVMGEVGFVSQNRTLLDRLEKSGMHVLTEQDLLDAMALAVARSAPGLSPTPPGAYCNASQILLGVNTTVPISSPANRVAWKRDMRLSIYRNINGAHESSASGVSDQNSLKGFLAACGAHPGILAEEAATTKIAQALASALANFLLRDSASVSLDDSLPKLGVDSLVAMEVRNWIRQQLGVETSVFVLLQSASLLQLGDHLRQALIARLG
ncbi:polyketide synthase [Aspergillus sclerotioniger CBS 115572]|uniref:Polyketide synthase n=1 Tax=Aspergillus sclerotioniger CBS 115572 TaxID=1450535 RepID=A0A317WZ53_9EURO|nr:polyketide synthase [Aspergillus sclerotioniger CBS 115572]PWY91664.1 polyketide synthase [Aspergillus sclerotioniger CBS 115572]